MTSQEGVPPQNLGAARLRGLGSAEVTRLLRLFLGLDPEPLCRVTHSLKSTLLSWASNFGLAPNTRSVLGRRSATTLESQALYARDLVVAPNMEMQKVLDAIHDGAFDPDAPRSMYFQDVAPPRC